MKKKLVWLIGEAHSANGHSVSEDMFNGEPNHPQCPFFEAFPSSPDPDENFYGEFCCFMLGGIMLKSARAIIYCVQLLTED